MRLRQRLLIWMGVTLLALSAILYFTVSHLTMSSYHDLERVYLRRDIQRVSDAIHQQIANLHDSTLDWSAWDDSYRFMADHNREYWQSNLSTLSLKIDVILYIDEQGNYYESKVKKRLSDVPPPDARRLFADLNRLTDVMRHDLATKDFTGLAMHKGTPMMLSVRPITDTAETKPPRGRIVFGLYLDSTEMQQISAQTHLDARFQPTEMAEIRSDLRQNPLANGAKVATAFTPDRAVGYAELIGLDGRPIGVVSATTSRMIDAKGRESLWMLFAVLLLIGFGIVAVTLTVFDFAVLGRIQKMSDQLQDSRDDEERCRVSVKGKDEISWLAQSINRLLDIVRDRTENIARAHGDLQRTVSDLAEKNAILQHAVDGISQLDSEGRILSANLAFAETFGRTTDELIGIHWEELFVPSEASRCLTAFAAVQRTKKEELSLHADSHGGGHVHIEAVLIAAGVGGPRSSGCHLFVKDVSERKLLERELEHQAFHDSLTGFPNRAMFMDRLESACLTSARKNTGLSVIFVDMDNFKVINDSLGHDAGDNLLVNFAQRLRATVSKGAVARIGGDEFTVLLADIDSPYEAEQVAEAILHNLRTPIMFGDMHAYVNVSIGIAYAAPGHATPEGLLRDADTAMYEAKARGKGNFVMFDQHMNRRAVDRLELEIGLRNAIKNSEFALQFQPIVDIDTRRITGVEALVRWEHPERGLVSPGAFIPIAEETGLINEIGAWVLEHSCMQLADWLRQVQLPEDFHLSVNLSGRQLQRPDIVDEVAAILALTGIQSTSLKLEITESVLMSDMDDAIRKMEELKRLGVQLALDDFGTGYSSMSSLSRFPLDTVKIDRCFVSRLGEQDADAVISAIIMLSNNLNCSITAEGIEHEDQIGRLKEMGCTYAQGYFFDRPLNATVITEKLRAAFPHYVRDAA